MESGVSKRAKRIERETGEKLAFRRSIRVLCGGEFATNSIQSVVEGIYVSRNGGERGKWHIHSISDPEIDV